MPPPPGCFPFFSSFSSLVFCSGRNTLRLAHVESAGGFFTLLELEKSQTSLSPLPRTMDPCRREGLERMGGLEDKRLQGCTGPSSEPNHHHLQVSWGLMQKTIVAGLCWLLTILYRRGWVAGPGTFRSATCVSSHSSYMLILPWLHITSGKC